MIRRHYGLRRLLILTLAFCVLVSNSALAAQMKDNGHLSLEAAAFSVLILGDSQMEGVGWTGGYANCIKEAYPESVVLNLARSGALLATGEIYEQWAFFVEKDFPAPDLVLLDGGVNDLRYMQKAASEEVGMEMVSGALKKLIEDIHRKLPDTQIIYLLMPPFAEWEDTDHGVPPYKVQEHYWKQMNMFANSYDYVTVVDLFALNPFRYPCAECYHMYLGDGIHLNETGYRKTFEYIDNVLMVNLLKEWIK